MRFRLILTLVGISRSLVLPLEPSLPRRYRKSMTKQDRSFRVHSEPLDFKHFHGVNGRFVESDVEEIKQRYLTRNKLVAQ